MNHSNSLDLVLTDKQSGEEWECSHDVAYIENLTRKTGNFKQFKVFVVMVKSGLLKTSECIHLDLYTYEDIESMRSRKIKSNTKLKNNLDRNRRYLVLTYTVEFDKISYPLPLEYCGTPDPAILQATIKKLEIELSKAREELNRRHTSNSKKHVKALANRIDELTEENHNLKEETKRLTKLLNKNPGGRIHTLEKAISQLEKSIKTERSSHHNLVEKLQNDKQHLIRQLDNIKNSERILKAKLQNVSQHRMKNKCDLITYEACQSQKTGLLARTKKDGNNCNRSRSASPKIINIDHQSKTKKKRTTTKPQSRSRSHSASSRKEPASDLLHRLQRGDSRTSSPMSRSSSLESLTFTSLNNTFSKTSNSRSSKCAAKTKSLEDHLNKLLKNYILVVNYLTHCYGNAHTMIHGSFNCIKSFI